VKAAGRLACLLYPSSVHCRAFNKMSKSARKVQSPQRARVYETNYCNNIIAGKCIVHSVAFNISPGESRHSELGRNSYTTSNGVRRRKTGWEAPLIDMSCPVRVAGTSSPTRKKRKAESDAHRAILVQYGTARQTHITTDRTLVRGLCYPIAEFRADFVVAVENLYNRGINGLQVFLNFPVKASTTCPPCPWRSDLIPVTIHAVKRISCS